MNNTASGVLCFQHDCVYVSVSIPRFPAQQAGQVLMLNAITATSASCYLLAICLLSFSIPQTMHNSTAHKKHDRDLSVCLWYVCVCVCGVCFEMRIWLLFALPPTSNAHWACTNNTVQFHFFTVGLTDSSARNGVCKPVDANWMCFVWFVRNQTNSRKRLILAQFMRDVKTRVFAVVFVALSKRLLVAVVI